MRYSDKSVFEPKGPPALEHDPRRVIEILAPQLTPERWGRVRAVAKQRSLSVAPLLEDVADPHNGSAILRSCDAFGVARLHVVSQRNAFLASHKIAKGTERWIEQRRHPSVEDAARALRREGYALFVADMGGELRPETLSRFGPRVAIAFGNEHRGASDELRALADGSFAIPMQGFVESLNVSVAAAITLYTLSRDLHAPMSEEERLSHEARILLSVVHRGPAIVRERLGAPAIAQAPRAL